MLEGLSVVEVTDTWIVELPRWISNWYLYLQAVSVLVSAYTLVAISVDRYLAIMWPLKPRMSKRQAKVIIGIVWLVALWTALPILLLSNLVQPIQWYEKCDRFVCLEKWDNLDYRNYYTWVPAGC